MIGRNTAAAAHTARTQRVARIIRCTVLSFIGLFLEYRLSTVCAVNYFQYEGALGFRGRRRRRRQWIGLGAGAADSGRAFWQSAGIEFLQPGPFGDRRRVVDRVSQDQ